MPDLNVEMKYVVCVLLLSTEVKYGGCMLDLKAVMKTLSAPEMYIHGRNRL